MLEKEKSITLAFTGASGAPYGLRLLENLLAAEYRVYLLISSAARVVLATEHGLKLPANPEAAQQALVRHLACAADKLVVCGKDDWFSGRVWLGGTEKDGGLPLLCWQCRGDRTWYVGQLN